MALMIDDVVGDEAVAEFVAFADRANAGRRARWPALPTQASLLKGTGPGSESRTVRPLVAREGGDVVARAAAVVDQGYIERWDEPLGHVIMFEALPGTFEATRALMDEACGWLKSHGMKSARAGCGPGFDMAFAIDDYESLPPMPVRQNASYYHSLLKEARFETERGWVDYKIEVTPGLVKRWEHMVESAQAAGFRLLRLRDVPEDRRVAEFTDTWEDAFSAHWGMAPTSEEEFAEVLAAAALIGTLEASVIAYRDDRPVGVVWAMPEATDMAVVEPGYRIPEAERLNFLGIGVRAEARGQGVNLAMAAACYLGLVARGATHLSYTMVLDDNWPSRRTAEKLGARVCANYVVYKRTISMGRDLGL
jgi:hypothetical protein